MALTIQKAYNETERVWDLALEGEVDLHTAEDFKQEVRAMLQDKKQTIRLDCRHLEYMDSTGLSVLISALKQLQQEDKNIIVTNLNPNIKKLLNITGLDRIIIVQDSSHS